MVRTGPPALKCGDSVWPPRLVIQNWPRCFQQLGRQFLFTKKGVKTEVGKPGFLLNHSGLEILRFELKLVPTVSEKYGEIQHPPQLAQVITGVDSVDDESVPDQLCARRFLDTIGEGWGWSELHTIVVNPCDPTIPIVDKSCFLKTKMVFKGLWFYMLLYPFDDVFSS